MKAEREDWTDQRRKQSISPWLIFGGTSVAIWILIALFAKPIVINIDQLKQAISFGNAPPAPIQHQRQQTTHAPQLDEAKRHALLQHALRQALQNDQAKPQSNQDQKQTSFNDNNYIPRGAINSMQPPATAHYAAAVRPAQRQNITRRNNSANWTWTGADRKKTHIQIQWRTGNGWIEFDTVCHNHKRGSIIYRECRKAAKDYFRHRCKTESNQAFCLAENRYFP